MIAVADTSPINYLVQVEAIDLLPLLFGQVLIPRSVDQELNHSNTPRSVRDWILHPPAWLAVRSAIIPPKPALLRLDEGEREAIQLALEFNIRTILIDETEGRQMAESLGLEARGTLGILERGAKIGRLDLREALRKLEETNFRISPGLREAIIKRNP